MNRSSQQHATTTSTTVRHRVQRYATRSHLAQALTRTWQPNQRRMSVATRHMLVAAPPLRGRQRMSKNMVCAQRLQRNIADVYRLPLANTYTTALSRRSTLWQPPRSAATRAPAPLRGASDADRHTRMFGRRGSVRGELTRQTLVSTMSWATRGHACSCAM